MRALLLVALVLLSGCSAPDLRGAIVEVGDNVNFDAAILAVDGLNAVTENDTALAIGTCVDSEPCIVIKFKAGLGEGRQDWSGYTPDVMPWEDSATVYVSETGNSAGTIAHELIHAIGVRGHAERPELDECNLMNAGNDPASTRHFGPGSANLYNLRFDTHVAPQMPEWEGTVLFPGVEMVSVNTQTLTPGPDGDKL